MKKKKNRSFIQTCQMVVPSTSVIFILTFFAIGYNVSSWKKNFCWKKSACRHVLYELLPNKFLFWKKLEMEQTLWLTKWEAVFDKQIDASSDPFTVIFTSWAGLVVSYFFPNFFAIIGRICNFYLSLHSHFKLSRRHKTHEHFLVLSSLSILFYIFGCIILDFRENALCLARIFQKR